MFNLSQSLAVTWMNLRSIPQRWGSSGVIVIGIAGVVGVLVSVLAMSEGFKATLGATGSPDRAIVLREGANAELSSTMSRESALILGELTGVKKSAAGAPLVSAEASVILNVPKQGVRSNLSMRGVSAAGVKLRGEFKLLEGRLYTSGLREVIVGAQAAREFDGLSVGKTLKFREADWVIVGIFSTGGDVHESELWADGETVLAAYRRNQYQSAVVQLTSEDAFVAFEQAAKSDPRLQVSVFREPDYYAEQSKALSTVINVMGTTVAAIMAVGALFGALNSLYAAVATRSREIATLRALGFGATAVVISVVVEALLLAGLGGALGGAVAWLMFNGFSVSTLNFSSFSQVAFQLSVSVPLLLKGFFWALGIGLVGALLPALKAARLPVAEALRSQ